MPLAFAPLPLARRFHGFSCRGESSLFRLGLTTNRASIGAFAAGVVLLAAVLFIPGLTTLFQVAPLTLPLLGIIVGLAFAPTLVIQIWKVLRDLKRSR